MARVTIEDCLTKVTSRFELTVLAAHRAHAILAGDDKLIKCNNKEIVTALREISEGKIDIDEIRSDLISRRSEGKPRERKSSGSMFFVDNDIDTGIFAESDKKSNTVVSIDSNIFDDHNIDVED